MNEDNIFTLTKFRWVLLKDKKIYERVVFYLNLSTMGVSRDTQLRVLKIIRAIIAKIGGGDDIFEFGYKTMSERWNRLTKLVSTSNRFSLQELAPQNCTYFREMRDPSPGKYVTNLTRSCCGCLICELSDCWFACSLRVVEVWEGRGPSLRLCPLERRHLQPWRHGFRGRYPLHTAESHQDTGWLRVADEEDGGSHLQREARLDVNMVSTYLCNMQITCILGSGHDL